MKRSGARTNITHQHGPMVLVLSLLLAASNISAQAPASETVLNGARIRGEGKWREETSGPPVQRWNVDLVRKAGDELEGQVTLDGSPLLSVGSLRGVIDGSAVTGTISDPEGRHVARFSGKLRNPGGLSGRYEDRNGGVGFWVWEGSLP